MLLIRFVTEAQQLKILFITTFTLPTFQLHEIPFSIKSQLLTDPLLIKMKSKLFKLSIMENQSIHSVNDNKLILDASIKYILENKRFNGPIF